ncbi:MAG: hypothetical protein JXB09_05060 [Deltaproteobacteria bacterium]|nr:hypothetical protein [Deltaproteobacteria bacterium]
MIERFVDPEGKMSLDAGCGVGRTTSLLSELPGEEINDKPVIVRDGIKIFVIWKKAKRRIDNRRN